jgi:hypothetical protein
VRDTVGQNYLIADFKLLSRDLNNSPYDDAEYRHLKHNASALTSLTVAKTKKYIVPHYTELLKKECILFFKHQESGLLNFYAKLDCQFTEFFLRSPLAKMIPAAAKVIHNGDSHTGFFTINELSKATTTLLSTHKNHSDYIHCSVIKCIFNFAFPEFNSFPEENLLFMQRCNDLLTRPAVVVGLTQKMIDSIQSTSTVESVFKMKKIPFYDLLHFFTNPIDMALHISDCIGALPAAFEQHKLTKGLKQALIVAHIVYAPPSNCVDVFYFLKKWLPLITNSKLQKRVNLFCTAVDLIMPFQELLQSIADNTNKMIILLSLLENILNSDQSMLKENSYHDQRFTNPNLTFLSRLLVIINIVFLRLSS